MSNTSRDSKIADLVASIKSKKTTTDLQKALIALYEKADRTKEDQKKFDALVKHEIARVKMLDAAAKAKSVLKQAKPTETRKQRASRLIKAGALFELAGIADWSRGELLGIALSAKSADEAQRAEWKSKGDVLLALKEVKRKTN